MSGPIAAGENVVLRDREPEDADTYLRWMGSGQWRSFDAPWERVNVESPEDQAALRVKFLAKCENVAEPRNSAIIVLGDGRPLGWVNRYIRRRGMTDTWFLGIDICEDEFLGRGLGSEALALWIDYLFEGSEVHKLAIDTWSFNERMMHVAGKLGFTLEGRRREEIEWEGRWQDRMEYGLLRSEWKS